MYDFGNFLKEKRKAKGFTQLMLAFKIGIREKLLKMEVARREMKR